MNSAPVNFNNPAYTSLYPIYPNGDEISVNYAYVYEPAEFRILLAVIKQGEEYFYVWSNLDSDFE